MTDNTNLNGTQSALAAGALVAVAVGLLLAGIAMPAAADHSHSTENDSNGADDGEIEPGDSEENDEGETCEADIDSVDVHTADSIIDGADDPARVGVTALTSITNECPVVVQVTFDIPNNMYYQGTSASSSGQGLQTETFEVNPGDTASFTSTMYSNQPGDRTVTADVEYFPEGQPENARSLDNLMLSFDVQDPVPEEEWPDPGPNDGGSNDSSGSDGDPDDSSDGDGGSSDDSSDDGGDGGPVEAIANNIVAVLAILTLGSVALALARKGLTILKT